MENKTKETAVGFILLLLLALMVMPLWLSPDIPPTVLMHQQGENQPYLSESHRMEKPSATSDFSASSSIELTSLEDADKTLDVDDPLAVFDRDAPIEADQEGKIISTAGQVSGADKLQNLKMSGQLQGNTIDSNVTIHPSADHYAFNTLQNSKKENTTRLNRESNTQTKAPPRRSSAVQTGSEQVRKALPPPTKPTSRNPVAKKPTAKKPADKKPTAGKKAKWLQSGSFSKRENAEKQQRLLRNKGFNAVISTHKRNHVVMHKVLVGPVYSDEEKNRYIDKLKKTGIQSVFTTER